jgi:hypothetical protein
VATVDDNISDLFFNTEIPAACITSDAKGQFIEYDHAGMMEHARTFLGCLERLNVTVPTPEELMSDFYGRV